MRKIDLTNYTVPNEDGKGISYEVKKSLINILLHPDLQLTAVDLLERDRLAHKINDCQEKSILLEDSEYGKIRDSMERLRGFGRADVELVQRIFEAKQIQVEEKRLKSVEK